MDKPKIGNSESDLEDGEILDDDCVVETVQSNVLKQVGTDKVQSNVLKQVGTNKVLAKDNVKKNTTLKNKTHSVVQLEYRRTEHDFAFGVTGLPPKIGQSILEKALFHIIRVERKMILRFEEYEKTLWVYFRNLETMMFVLKIVLHKKMEQHKLNVEVVQCREGQMDAVSHKVLTELHFTNRVVVYVHTSIFSNSTGIPVVRYTQNQHSLRKDNQAHFRKNEARSTAHRKVKEDENWDFDPSTIIEDSPSPVKPTKHKRKEKQDVPSSGTHSTSSATSDARCSPVSASTPSLPQVEVRDGCTCCDFDYEVYHSVDFMDQTYNQQVNLKTTHVLRMLDKLEARLLRTCVNLEQYIHKKQQENNGLFCYVNSFLECPPNKNSTWMCTFEGGKEEEAGVYELGFRLRSCRVRKLSHVKHSYPDHVVEAAKVIVKMGSSKLWKDVIIYTNRAKKLMLQFVLESDNNDTQEFLEYNLIDFFTKRDGKCCDVASIYIKIPGKLQSQLVMGTAYLEESLGGMKILLLPTDPLWSDFRAAEMMCKVVEQLISPTRTTTVLEMGCGNGLIGLYLSKAAGQVLGIDCCNYNIRVAKRNAENVKAKNCEYFDGNTLTVLSRVSKIISHKSVCALVLNKLSPPVADVMMELRKITDLNKVALLMEIDTVSKFVLPLSITDNTEELGNPFFITKVVPIDTLPNTKKYLVVVLMERINIRNIEKMESCSGSLKSVKKKHRCFGLGNKCKEVNNCNSTSKDIQQNKVIRGKNVCEKQVVLKEKSYSKGVELQLANKQKSLMNKILLENKQNDLVNEILLVNKQQNLMNKKSSPTGRELFLMIKQNTLMNEKSCSEGRELFLMNKQDTLIGEEQNEHEESEENISGAETGDEQICEDEETTKLRIMIEEQRKLIEEEQNKFLLEINQEQKRLLTEEVQKKFQDRSEETKLKAEEELRKVFLLVEQKQKRLQIEEENGVLQTKQRRLNTDQQTEEEQRRLQAVEKMWLQVVEQRRLQAEEQRRQKAEEHRQKAEEKQKEIEAWKKRVDAELQKHEEWSRLKSEEEQRFFEKRRKALSKEWDKKRKRKETEMPERKRRRKEEEIKCHRNKQDSWRTSRKEEYRRDDVNTYDDKNKHKYDDSDSQNILVKQTLVKQTLEKLMCFINEGGHTKQNKESSTRTCLDNTAGPSREATPFDNTLDKLKDIMKAVIETSATLIEDNTSLKQ